MIGTFSHDLHEETPEAKARWFQAPSLEERMEMLCLFTEPAFQNNPLIAERKNDQPAAGSVRVLSNNKG